MITFNALLHYEDIDPAVVKLVRHQDKRFIGRPTPYRLWRVGDPGFELYQSLQGRDRIYADAQLLASFVATPFDETLFVGLYEIHGVGRAAEAVIDPVSGETGASLYQYDLRISPKLEDYRGKLSIRWGQGYRAWVQRAASQQKPVVEIRRSESEPPFPGFLSFCERLSGLVSVPRSWRDVLAAVGGVYLLSCPESGKQYVGSAYGPSGFWGRWEDYAANGHGGNQMMRELPRADYQISVLEVAASSAKIEDIIELESRWKCKLLTRKFGLNAN